MNSEVIEIFEMITSLKDYNVQNKNKIKHDEYLKKKPQPNRPKYQVSRKMPQQILHPLNPRYGHCNYWQYFGFRCNFWL